MKREGDVHAASQPRLDEMDANEHLSDPSIRQKYVTAMFDIIAPRYDDFTRLFSFGMDARWKKHIISGVRSSSLPTGILLDLASGTGDLALELSGAFPDRTVVAVDASRRMLEVARGRVLGAGWTDDTDLADSSSTGSRVLLVGGDAMCLPLAAGSASLVTAAYCFRNLPEFRVALRGLRELMMPGGVLVSLDFFQPESAVWRSIFLSYLAAAGNVVGWWWHRSPPVYGYIARSIRHFVTARDFAAELARAGFEVENTRTWLGGGIAAHFARRSR